ncbi:MAG TPA: deoxyguanosinetriphosphate triphosphohydrolase [Chloroflexia bacterium]|nr:deoxyguanosinetriphosphate triphosphohydrolase [Chloroflexia bacterium]
MSDKTMSPERVRERLEREEYERLSPLAAKAADATRPVPEEESPLRTAFMRDRDRIIHSKSFRRLKHKTQVFIGPIGDHYRTRLTHTLEMSQIARTMARALRMNEDVTEAIALAHDLGHTPFGHAGEDALRKIYDPKFKHNHQSLRIVDYLAKDGVGLNLTDEVREALVTSTPVEEGLSSEGMGHGSIESKLVKLADTIAYINHDTDDAIRANIIRPGDIPSAVCDVLGNTNAVRINTLVSDIISQNWEVAYPGEELASQDRKSIELKVSPRIEVAADTLKQFLYNRVYIGSEAKAEESKVNHLIRALFEYFCKHIEELPPELKSNPRNEPTERLVVDYISGMTDRFAISTFERIFVPRSWSS